jgi:hypothetical protein
MLVNVNANAVAMAANGTDKTFVRIDFFKQFMCFNVWLSGYFSKSCLAKAPTFALKSAPAHIQVVANIIKPSTVERAECETAPCYTS